MLPTELIPFTAEQHEIVGLCRRFGTEEIRPAARSVEDADTQTPWEFWRSAEEGTSNIQRMLIARDLRQ